MRSLFNYFSKDLENVKVNKTKIKCYKKVCGRILNNV